MKKQPSKTSTGLGLRLRVIPNYETPCPSDVFNRALWVADFCERSSNADRWRELAAYLIQFTAEPPHSFFIYTGGNHVSVHEADGKPAWLIIREAEALEPDKALALVRDFAEHFAEMRKEWEALDKRVMTLKQREFGALLDAGIAEQLMERAEDLNCFSGVDAADQAIADGAPSIEQLVAEELQKRGFRAHFEDVPSRIEIEVARESNVLYWSCGCCEEQWEAQLCFESEPLFTIVLGAPNETIGTLTIVQRIESAMKSHVAVPLNYKAPLFPS